MPVLSRASILAAVAIAAVGLVTVDSSQASARGFAGAGAAGKPAGNIAKPAGGGMTRPGSIGIPGKIAGRRNNPGKPNKPGSPGHPDQPNHPGKPDHPGRPDLRAASRTNPVTGGLRLPSPPPLRLGLVGLRIPGRRRGAYG